MLIKASKTFCNELKQQMKKDEEAKNYGVGLDVVYDCFYGEKKVIKITYPAEYYAMPTLLDGEDLLKAYRRSDKTFEGYFNTLIEDYIKI